MCGNRSPHQGLASAGLGAVLGRYRSRPARFRPRPVSARLNSNSSGQTPVGNNGAALSGMASLGIATRPQRPSPPRSLTRLIRRTVTETDGHTGVTTRRLARSVGTDSSAQ